MSPTSNPAPSACKPNGCIMIMQSLDQIGFNPCYNSDPQYLGTCPPFGNRDNGNLTAIPTWIYWLTKLGASAKVLFANGMNSANVGYSFIANAQWRGCPELELKHPEWRDADRNHGRSVLSGFGCAATRGIRTPLRFATIWGGRLLRIEFAECAKCGAALRSSDSGQLQLLFTFAQNAPQVPYSISTSTVNGALTNTVTINNTQFINALLQNTPGFRLLILNSNSARPGTQSQFDKTHQIS